MAQRLSELLGVDVPLVRDWVDGVEVAAGPAGAARELPHERRRGQGRRGAVEEVRRAVRRVRHGRLRHRAPRAGLHARRDQVRQGRRRRPAADGRTRCAGQGARQPGAAAAGDRRRLQGVDQARTAVVAGRQGRPADRRRRHRQHLHRRDGPRRRQVAGRDGPDRHRQADHGRRQGARRRHPGADRRRGRAARSPPTRRRRSRRSMPSAPTT